VGAGEGVHRCCQAVLTLQGHWLLKEKLHFGEMWACLERLARLYSFGAGVVVVDVGVHLFHELNVCITELVEMANLQAKNLSIFERKPPILMFKWTCSRWHFATSS
jgi:hypothetical protein